MTFAIPALAKTLDSDLLNKINNKTKPLGSLGQLEQLALRIGRIQQTPDAQVLGTASARLRWRPRRRQGRRFGVPAGRDLADGGELPGRWRRDQRVLAPSTASH